MRPVFISIRPENPRGFQQHIWFLGIDCHVQPRCCQVLAFKKLGSIYNTFSSLKPLTPRILALLLVYRTLVWCCACVT